VLLGVLTITFMCGIFVINSFFVTQMRVQQENATDSAALAAAEVLANEDLLYADSSIFGLRLPEKPGSSQAASPAPLFGLATQSALDFADRNFVAGKSFGLHVEDVAYSITNLQTRTSDGLISALESPASNAATFSLTQKRAINAVQVTGRSTKARGNAMRLPIFNRMSWEMTTRSEAVLDGYVYGFHTDPSGEINIPMAPIGLNARSWAVQVESSVDLSRERPADGRLPFGDFKVMLGAIAQDPDSNDSSKIAPMIHFGTSTLTEAISQLNSTNPGILPAQYDLFFQANNRQPLALDAATLRLSLPTAPQPNRDNTDLGMLESKLRGLSTTRLIWPLISGYNDGNPQRQAVITGFVAARIIDVKRTSYRLLTDRNGDAVPGSKEQGTCEEGMDDQGRTRRPYDVLELTLHPTLLATSTAMVFVKDWPRTDQNPFRFPNAYVKKIRLIK
jgi:hypothetical protein